MKDYLMPYSPQEKNWLKKHFNNEFIFLRSHMLNIHKEEDRQEGRQLLRFLMWKEEDERSEC